MAVADELAFTGEAPDGPRRTEAVDRAARVVSILSDYGLVVALLEALSVLRRRRTVRSALVRLAVVGSTVFGVNVVLKRLVQRPRPEKASEPAGLVRPPTSASFPSGHTLAATAAAVALPESGRGIALSLGGAGLVGWSRLRLGSHHASDVAGGFAIGVCLGMACRAALRRLDP
jgi:membrane-associated phospholipid phosphatase